MTDYLLSVDSITKHLPAAVVTANKGAGSDKFAAGFQVNVADYATPHLAMAAVAAGGRVYFPAGIYALGGTPLTAAVDNVHIDALGATFTLSTWGKPAFDLLDVDGWTLDIGLVQYIGTRDYGAGSFRGQNVYTQGSGVYTNGDRHHIRRLRTIGMPTPINLSSWDGVSFSGRIGVGNRIGKLECEGYDFGVLWVAQRDLVIEDLYAHDDIDDSSGANPTHAYYASGLSTARSTGVTIKRARCENNVGGHAFQLKYADQVTLSAHSADGCAGLVNIQDCDDLTWNGMEGVNLTSLSGGRTVSLGYTVADCRRPKLSNTSVAHAANQDLAVASIWADDAQIDGLTVYANRSAGTTITENDVILRGANGRVRGLTLRSRGAAHGRGATLGYGAATATGWVVEDVVVEAARSAVDVVAGGSGNSVRYDPSSVALTGTGAAVTITGTATGAEVAIITPVQVSLSPFGEHAALHSLAAATPTVPVANAGIQCLVTPRRDIVVSHLMWFSASASGNYDVAIIDDASNVRLWSKGSTAWPSAGAITETVTGVTMRAGRTYRLVFAADNTVGTYRGSQAPSGDMLTRMDGRFAAYLTTAMFPIPTPLVIGSGSSTRIPLLIVKGT